MAGKADLVNSIAGSVEGSAVPDSSDDTAYASLDAAAAAGAETDRGGGWVADG